MNLTLPKVSYQEFLRSRRSVRRFLTRSIEPGILESILETATHAPSAHNRQPWRFLVLTSERSKITLAEEMGADFQRDLLNDGVDPKTTEKLVSRSRNRILEAPVVFILCLDIDEGDSYPDPARQQAEFIMGVQGVAMAGGTMLLAAHAEGLGGVWVCAPLFAQETVQRAFDLPENWHPQGMLLLGYPAEIPEPRQRKPLEEVVLFL